MFVVRTMGFGWREYVAQMEDQAQVMPLKSWVSSGRKIPLAPELGKMFVAGNQEYSLTSSVATHHNREK